MFDPKSDYALNKVAPDAIVYTDSNGILIRLTPDDFSSLEEFLRWKVWSDEDYHTTENEEHIFSNKRRHTPQKGAFLWQSTKQLHISGSLTPTITAAKATA